MYLISSIYQAVACSFRLWHKQKEVHVQHDPTAPEDERLA